MSQNFSTGRGGAGNIGKELPADSSDLATPTIKADTYTTGRGGSGNMTKNDPNHPEIARASQDLEPVEQREPQGSFHVGRGGAANVGKSSEEGFATDNCKDLLDDVAGNE